MTAAPPVDSLIQRIRDEFHCTRCGHCCKGDGLVKISIPEADRLAQALGLERADFLTQYAMRAGRDRWVLRDRWETPPGAAEPEQWCIFLFRDAQGLYGCQVNEAKPDQCASFPAAWHNPDSFETCPGLRRLIEPRQAQPAPEGHSHPQRQHAGK